MDTAFKPQFHQQRLAAHCWTGWNYLHGWTAQTNRNSQI